MLPRIIVICSQQDHPSINQGLSGKFNVVFAESTLEAYEIISNRQIDVVIASHELPSMSGTEFLEIIAQKHPKIQRILLTNGANPLDLIRAVNKAKVHAVALKPIQINELLNLVQDSIKNVQKIVANETRFRELQTQNEQFEFILRQRLLS